MTHSHDTATPALSVESEYVLVPREPTPEMKEAGARYNGGLYPISLYRAMIAAAPAPNPSPAAKGGEAVVVPYDDFHAAYRFVPRSKVSPDRCLKTRLRALLRAEDLAHADEAEALATPSPQPADAVREAVNWSETNLLRYCNEAQAGRYPSDPREFERRVDAAFRTIRAALTTPSPQPANAVRELLREVESETPPDDQPRDGQGAYVYMTWETIDAVRAALASDPAPAGERASEIKAWLLGDPSTGQWIEVDGCRVEYPRGVGTPAVVLAEAFKAQRSRADDAEQEMNIARFERDDARKALETVRAALKAWDDCPDHAFPSTVMEKAACLAEAVRAAFAARSASREGASDE